MILLLPRENRVPDLLNFPLKFIYLKIGPKFASFFDAWDKAACGAMLVFRADRDERATFLWDLIFHE